MYIRTDAYKMAVATVLALWLMRLYNDFFRKFYIFVPVRVIRRAGNYARKYGNYRQAFFHAVFYGAAMRTIF